MPSKNKVGRPGRQNLGLVSEVYCQERKDVLVPQPEPDEAPTPLPNSENEISPEEEHEVRDVEVKELDLTELDLTELEPKDLEPKDAAPNTDDKSEQRQAGEQNTVKQPHQQTSHSSENNKQSIPERFGSYELVWEICRDALSTTYAARSANIDRLLAIRIFSARLTDAAQIRSIQKAANKAAELTHTNLVNVYENGLGENGAPYLVTDWVEGDSLADVFRVSKRLDVGRFLGIFNQVCDALIEAHSRLLPHGNLSPNKIILSANDQPHDLDCDLVKIIDFGMPPDPVQNAFYLSPEQRLDSIRVDARTDIYSLGCVMYEALVGSPPFVGHKMSNASLNYLHELAAQYSPDSPEHNALKLLDCIIIKCLQQDPSKRFRNVRELVDALRLVSDCIFGGNTRKLPPKAEKLLLFRFLDFFDKKIVACMFAYLLLAGLSLKFIGETQLQKYIDEAQSARQGNSPLAQEYWLTAIQQAEWLGKPPSLIADLHWELAETYDEASKEPGQGSSALVKDAMQQYKQTLGYFSHGIHYQSYTLTLLHRIANLSMQIEPEDIEDKLREPVLEQAHKLLAQKKYSECAKLCSEFLRKFEDSEIAFCASTAYNELGTTVSAKKGATYFERAIFYGMSSDQSTNAANQNLLICLGTLVNKFPATTGDTFAPTTQSVSSGDYLGLLKEALAAGDAEAAAALVGGPNWAGITQASEVNSGLASYHSLEVQANSIVMKDPNVVNAIEPLEQALKIEEKTYGLHSFELIDTLMDLANCYRTAGEDQKALDTYKRVFSIKPHSRGGTFRLVGRSLIAEYEWEDQELATWNYAHLLIKTGQSDKATQLLEKRIFKKGNYRMDSPFFMRLLQLYGEQKLTSKLNHAISEATITTAEGFPAEGYAPKP